MKIIKLINPLLLIALVSNSSLLFAKEIPAGTIEVSGALDISYSDRTRSSEGLDDIVTDTQNVNSSITYYVVPNLSVGLDWQHQSEETVYQREKDESSYNAIGPIISYNLSFTDNFSLKTSATLSSVTSEYSGTNSATVRADGSSWSVLLGFGYFINNNVSLNASLRYKKISLEEDFKNTKYDTTYFGPKLGISIYIN